MRAASAILDIPALAFLLTTIGTAPTLATPVTWPTNGHSYEVFYASAGVPWQTAYDSCQTLGGYLATLTSSDEHAFVYGLVSGRPELWYIDSFGNGIGPWLGGMQPTGSSEPGGGWRWVSGEEWSYTAWSPGEPNNSNPAGEDRLCFFKVGGLIGDRWNDLTQGQLVKGWILETQPPAQDCSTWGANGHNYQIVRTPGRVTWDFANTEAIARGGHLATITSSSENDFIVALAAADPTLWRIDAAGNGQGPWIGAFQPGGSPEPAGGWAWVTTEPFSYTNWAPAEPNNLNGTEDRLQLFGKGTLTGGYWNDIPNDTPYGGLGYVVEYESGPGCVSVGVEASRVPGLELSSPAPNPARAVTLLHFELPRSGTTSLRIYGIHGECVRTLVERDLASGPHSCMWDGLTARGSRAAPGIYLVRLDAEGVIRTRRLVLIGP